ncbi:HAMP domain-containing protein [Pseudidiomarina planktonica]|uniref:histidine kinase n=1 Tax=Pseudidiomarina planktonica TaxID=1323738 RepID=A0A1Y6EBA9_9GAMM|nr:ATP-binding protein [Pseudidiomarina planktonica]SMQ57902.1 HAMP domain-containing protein [Pseudidiomarina planktonica]
MSKVSKHSRWRLSGLQRTLLLYVVIPMLVLSGLVIRFGLQFANDLVTDRLESDLELVGRAIRLPISEALAADNMEAVRANLDSVFTIGQVYGASVYDTEGNQVASAGITESDLTESVLAEQVVSTGREQDSFRSVEGRDVYSRFLPVIDRGGQINGLIQITRRASDFERSVDQLARLAWLSWGVLAIATVCILIFGHYRAVGRHIELLVNSMRKVAQGDRQHRAQASGPAELQEFARGLNGMLDSIAAAEREILQRREHEIDLLKQLREQEKMAAIGQVASGVAHELGAPLTVIDGRAQRLLKKHDDADSQRQLQAVRGQVQRLTRMVRQLLAFSRTPVAVHEQVLTGELIEQARESVSYEQQANGPELKLVPPAQDFHVAGDVQRLELALVNVMRNALQAATSQVQIAWTQQQNQVLITIRDDGKGLPTESSNQPLTTPFVTTKEQGEGTGLGLAIVQYVISDHGGTLQLANHPDGGCEVSILLPCNINSGNSANNSWSNS